jgi:hypothetical protein
LQIHAERLDCAVGSLQFEVHIMLEGGEEVAEEAAKLSTSEMGAYMVGVYSGRQSSYDMNLPVSDDSVRHVLANTLRSLNL